MKNYNEKQKQYILNNWKKYNCVDSKEDMFALLNILEAHEENLDTFHRAYFEGLDMFCGIVGSFESDRDTARALFDFNLFFNNKEELYKFAEEQIEAIYKEEENVTVGEYLKYEDIRETSGGIVLVLYY